jgi:hypothetical protein
MDFKNLNAYLSLRVALEAKIILSRVKDLDHIYDIDNKD